MGIFVRWIFIYWFNFCCHVIGTLECRKRASVRLLACQGLIVCPMHMKLYHKNHLMYIHKLSE